MFQGAFDIETLDSRWVLFESFESDFDSIVSWCFLCSHGRVVPRSLGKELLGGNQVGAWNCHIVRAIFQCIFSNSTLQVCRRFWPSFARGGCHCHDFGSHDGHDLVGVSERPSMLPSELDLNCHNQRTCEKAKNPCVTLVVRLQRHDQNCVTGGLGKVLISHKQNWPCRMRAWVPTQRRLMPNIKFLSWPYTGVSVEHTWFRDSVLRHKGVVVFEFARDFRCKTAFRVCLFSPHLCWFMPVNPRAFAEGLQLTNKEIDPKPHQSMVESWIKKKMHLRAWHYWTGWKFCNSESFRPLLGLELSGCSDIYLFGFVCGTVNREGPSRSAIKILVQKIWASR